MLAALIAASCPAAASAFDIDVSVIQADPAANPSGYRVMLKALAPAAKDIAPRRPTAGASMSTFP